MKRFFGIIIFLILIFTASRVGLFIYQSKKSAPILSGQLKLKDLAQKVTVTTDDFGIPHIEAENEEDLFYAFGFVAAKERLFQMEMLRRIGSGRLSEILGSPVIEADKLLRTLRLRISMEEFLNKHQARLDPHMLKLCQQFFKGINDYAATMPLPPEFSLLGLDRPEPFELVDAMAISGYMSLSFAEGLIGDLLFSELEKEFGPVKVALLRKGATGDNLPLPDLGRDAANKVSWNKLLSPLKVLEESFGLFHGSNSFVLDGSRTESGKPILSNDPHIAFSSPGTWFEAHLKSPTFEIYGHFIPLVPFPVLGHNQDKAWGITMSEVDDLDLYEETLNDKGEVLVGEKSYPVLTQEELIKVRFGKDETIKVSRSIHGPFLNDTMMVGDSKEKPIAIAWSFHHPDNDIVSAFYNLSRADNVKEFRSALSSAAAPALNISWIDKSGDIAWQVVGKIPLRKEGVATDILLDGKNPDHQYLGYVDYEKNPHAINPLSGVIVSTNYIPPVKVDYPMDGYWQPSERYLRINSLLAKKQKWKVSDLRTVMTDENTVSQKKQIDLLVSAAQKIGVASVAIKKLENWNGDSSINSTESSIYHLWSYWVMRLTFQDEMKDRYEAFTRVADYWHTFKNHMQNLDSPWWDNIETQDKETRDEILVRAFANALENLEERFGSDQNNWSWGKLHTVTYRHPLSKLPLVGRLFDLGPYAAGGGSFQVNNMSSPRFDDHYGVTLGPSTRRLIDLSDPAHSLGILPTGNSGHLESAYYKDQVQTYLDNKFRPQLLNINEIKTNQVLELLPKD